MYICTGSGLLLAAYRMSCSEYGCRVRLSRGAPCAEVSPRLEPEETEQKKSGQYNAFPGALRRSKRT